MAHANRLWREHLLEHVEHPRRSWSIQPSELVEQAHAVHRSNLIEHDLPLLPLNRHATRVG